MPPFPTTKDQVRKCEGTCGRLTRNTKMSKADYPDTITRVNATHCGSCFKALPENVRPKPTPRQLSTAQEKLRAERLESAHRAREQVEADRQARIQRRMVRRVPMGQAMVRI